jgi:hypothetical protein
MHLAIESKDEELKKVRETCQGLVEEIATLKETNETLERTSKFDKIVAITVF